MQGVLHLKVVTLAQAVLCRKHLPGSSPTSSRSRGWWGAWGPVRCSRRSPDLMLLPLARCTLLTFPDKRLPCCLVPATVVLAWVLPEPSCTLLNYYFNSM